MADPKDIIKKQSFQLDVDDNDGLPEAGIQQDIKQHQKVTLGKFIGNKTKNNVFPVDSNVNSDNTDNTRSSLSWTV